MLEGVEYAPTLALLLLLNGPSPLPQEGYARLGNTPGPLYWIADNSAKGISPPELGPALTIHGEPDFSRENYDAPEERVQERLLHEFQRLYPPQGRYAIAEAQLKKWRYARPLRPTQERAYSLGSRLPPAAVAGDAFGGARVEGAYLSGLAAAQLIDAALG